MPMFCAETIADCTWPQRCAASKPRMKQSIAVPGSPRRQASVARQAST
jgi:hypothetical protein